MPDSGKKTPHVRRVKEGVFRMICRHGRFDFDETEFVVCGRCNFVAVSEMADDPKFLERERVMGN
jgi:hypothetical protein